MIINDDIRQAVIAALSAQDAIPEATYFNGRPYSIAVGEDGEEDSELPAIAVYLDEGEATDEDFDTEEWSATLHVEVFALATNQMDAYLDGFGERIRQVIDRHFTAGGLLSSCSRKGFNYTRDEEQPWGTLDLTYVITLETE